MTKLTQVDSDLIKKNVLEYNLGREFFINDNFNRTFFKAQPPKENGPQDTPKTKLPINFALSTIFSILGFLCLFAILVT